MSVVLVKDVINEDGGVAVSAQVVFSKGSGLASSRFATRLT